MFICVDHLVKGFSENIKFNAELQLSNIQLLHPNVQVDVDGTLFNNGERYIFSAEVKANLNFQCHSCLDSFSKQISFEMNEVYAKTDIDDEEVLIFSSKDNIIDFTEAIKRNVILNLPMKAICSENCKGLCSSCGQNLNENKCDCNTEYINPKFEKILKLFKENKEEV